MVQQRSNYLKLDSPVIREITLKQCPVDTRHWYILQEIRRKEESACHLCIRISLTKHFNEIFYNWTPYPIIPILNKTLFTLIQTLYPRLDLKNDAARSSSARRTLRPAENARAENKWKSDRPIRFGDIQSKKYINIKT